MDKKLVEITIEKSIPIGQEEEDFESVFNQIFSKNDIMKEPQEEYHEMENKIYYLKRNENYVQKEEPKQILQKIDFINNKGKIISNKESIMGIDEDKKEIEINSKNLNLKNKKSIQNLEIFINRSFTGDENKNDDEKKNEANNFSNETDKQNKFRVYSLNDFNIFHPGGNVEYFMKIKEELNEEINNQLIEDNKSNKFKILKEKKKKQRKKVKEKKKRREKPDDIRKKIKSRFLKTTKNRMNQMLKSAKSKEFFDFLPQCFICNISKQANKSIINMKFKDLMSQKFFKDSNEEKDFIKDIFQQKKTNPDKKKYDNNMKTLKYLDKNNEICRKSNFNVIGNMTVKELFKEYLKSEEFEKEVEKLKDEQNDDKYIKDYILKAYGFIRYFSKDE